MGPYSHIFYINSVLAHVFYCFQFLNQLAQMFFMQVGTVTRLRVERRGVRIRVSVKHFLLSTTSTPALAPTHLPWRDFDHSPSSAKVKNEWSYTSTTPDMSSWRGKVKLYL